MRLIEGIQLPQRDPSNHYSHPQFTHVEQTNCSPSQISPIDYSLSPSIISSDFPLCSGLTLASSSSHHTNHDEKTDEHSDVTISARKRCRPPIADERGAKCIRLSPSQPLVLSSYSRPNSLPACSSATNSTKIVVEQCKTMDESLHHNDKEKIDGSIKDRIGVFRDNRSKSDGDSSISLVGSDESGTSPYLPDAPCLLQSNESLSQQYALFLARYFNSLLPESSRDVLRHSQLLLPLTHLMTSARQLLSYRQMTSSQETPPCMKDAIPPAASPSSFSSPSPDSGCPEVTEAEADSTQTDNFSSRTTVTARSDVSMQL